MRADAWVLAVALAACAPNAVVPHVTSPTTAAWFDRAVDRSSRIVIHVALDRAEGGLRTALESIVLDVVASIYAEGPNLRAAVGHATEAIITSAKKSDDALIVLRGVPPDVDPGALRATDGGREFGVRVAGEYVEYTYLPATGTLVVLSDGAWLMAGGPAAQDAKNAIERTGGAPVLPKRSGEPLADLWVPAAALREIAGQNRLRLLAPLLLHATSVTGWLGTDLRGELRVRFPTEAEAKEGRATLIDVKRVLAERTDSAAHFLGDATVELEGADVVVHATVPPAAIDAFVQGHL